MKGMKGDNYPGMGMPSIIKGGDIFKGDIFSKMNVSKVEATRKLEKLEVTKENGMLPVLGVFCAALVLLVASINYTATMTPSMGIYSKCVSSVSMALSFILLARIKQLKATSIFIRYFLFLWSFVGGCVLTFGFGPFAHTGNGYFCVWAMTIFSFLSLGINFDSVKSTVAEHSSPLATLGFCSFVVFLAVLPFLGSNYHWESIFSLMVSALTMIIVGIFVFKNHRNSKLPDGAFHVLVFLSIVWIFTAGIVTFRGPFLVTGNGYFASWGGAIIGVVAAKEAHEDDGIEEIVETAEDLEAPEQSDAPPQQTLTRPDDGTASRTAMLTVDGAGARTVASRTVTSNAL
jgi:hypothetical protein